MHRDDSSVFETLSSPVGVLVCEARTLQYGFYTASELRKLSVVQVTSKEQRDALNRPLPGGLYDPKMGPTDHYETCTSCGLDYSLCPGHIGHIDLALPTYSPVLFQHMLKLLKSKCFNCHRFRADATKLQKLAHAAELLSAGHVVDACCALEPDSGSDASRELRRVSRTGRPPPLSPHLLTVRQALHKKFFRTLAGAKNKCSHCQTVTGAMRTEGGYKIFCVPLSKSATTANQMLGAEAAARAAGQSTAVGGSANGNDDEDEDEDEDEENEQATGAAAAAGGAGPAGAGAPPSGSGGSLILMTPAEAERHLKDLWQVPGPHACPHARAHSHLAPLQGLPTSLSPAAGRAVAPPFDAAPSAT